MSGEDKENVSRKGLKNVENFSKEQKQWQSIKRKMVEYLNDKGYKLGDKLLESKWLGVLEWEFYSPLYASFPSERINDRNTLLRKFDEQELEKIENYIESIRSDLWKRTEFSTAGTISKGDFTKTPDIVVRRRSQEWLDGLDNILSMWDTIAAVGGFAIGAATKGGRIRVTSSDSKHKPTEKSLYVPLDKNNKDFALLPKGETPIKDSATEKSEIDLRTAIETGKEIIMDKRYLEKNPRFPKEIKPQSKSTDTHSTEINQLDITSKEKIQLSFETNFTRDQIRNWKANNFMKTPEDLSSSRVRQGFHVVIDKNTNEVIAAYIDDTGSEPTLVPEYKANGFSKLFDASFNMVVRPDMEGRGIGKEIFRRMIEKGKSLGAEHIRVHASNPGSFEWFQKYDPVKSTAEGVPGKQTGYLFFKIEDLEKKLFSKKGSLVEPKAKPASEGLSLKETKTEPEMYLKPEVLGKQSSLSDLNKLKKELNEKLEEIKNDPNLNSWRDKRHISDAEFDGWIRNQPEETQRDILDRLNEVGRTQKKISNKNFVLAHTPHEIRVNKLLKIWGLEGEHGDFKGPGSKAKKDIADGLSINADPKDSRVAPAHKKHNDFSPHHNPDSKKADDFIHQALDIYDAVTDPLRADPDYGYRKEVMDDKAIREKIMENPKTKPELKEALKIILKWKNEGRSPQELRKEYHEWFKNQEKKEISLKNEKTEKDLRIHEKQKIVDRNDKMRPPRLA